MHLVCGVWVIFVYELIFGEWSKLLEHRTLFHKARFKYSNRCFHICSPFHRLSIIIPLAWDAKYKRFDFTVMSCFLINVWYENHGLQWSLLLSNFVVSKLFLFIWETLTYRSHWTYHFWCWRIIYILRYTNSISIYQIY